MSVEYARLPLDTMRLGGFTGAPPSDFLPTNVDFKKAEIREVWIFLEMLNLMKRKEHYICCFSAES